MHPIFRWPATVVAGVAVLLFAAGFTAARRSAPKPAEPAAVLPSTDNTPARLAAGAQEVHPEIPWESRWQESSRRKSCPSVTRSRAALLEELARTNPKQALELALQEPNWLVRDELRAAALRGWGATAPDEASKWAMAQPVMGERMRCVSDVLAGAAENPDAAIRVALKACSEDPLPAGDYGHSLVNALVERTGDFAAAADFAREAGMVDRQSYLVDSAYYQWAQHDPERAFSELEKITDPDAHDAALKGVIEGCADADAKGLADFAKKMPEGDDRSRILAVALPEWVGKDPVAVQKWIEEAGSHPDFDKGLQALASLPSLVESRPDVAMDVTDSICDPVKRSLAKSNVFIQWARDDFDAASRFAQSVQNPEYRDMFMTDLETVTAGKAADAH